MPAIRPIRSPDDQTQHQTFDTSFTMTGIYRLRRGALSFQLVTEAVDPPMHKSYGSLLARADSRHLWRSMSRLRPSIPFSTDELTVREAGDYRYARVHRMWVDTYCLQHPDRYCVSAKSLAAHLTGLCWAFEYGGHPSVGKALLRWLDGKRAIEKPDLPLFRGEVTIADSYQAADARRTRPRWNGGPVPRGTHTPPSSRWLAAGSSRRSAAARACMDTDPSLRSG